MLRQSQDDCGVGPVEYDAQFPYVVIAKLKKNQVLSLLALLVYLLD